MIVAEHVYIENIGKHVGEEITLRGWLYNRRSKGKLHFLIVRDGTGLIQGVMFKGDVDEELFVKTDHLRQETSIEVDGLVKEDPRAPSGYELGVTDLRVIAEPSQEYPISPRSMARPS